MDEKITNNEVVEEETTEETTPEEDVEETTSDEEEETSDEEESSDEEDGIDWKERALKAEKAIEKNKQKQKKAPKKVSESNDEVIVARLEARGVLESDDQEYIMRVAKLEDMHYLEALEDPVVQDRLKANKKKRESAAASPRNNNRAPNQANELDRAVARFQKDGTLPDNPALTARVLDKVNGK